ncbi:Crp/Fnr family transcriptional regulator [Vallitalea okinawensis]|uniref:Crp/Fnr family transcriptional regulator n=1 Tax=Vallitalea okinawensis TaxID=2078660 RepID=UPI000CFE241C|nr:Crp/Fnr family transcriptional regulator [Vallitalea okinawensis]
MNLEELIKESDDIRELIKNMPIDIKKRCHIKRFEPDSVILKKMDEIKYVYILCKGECCVMNEFKEGYLYVFGRAKGIHFIGEQAVLADQLEAAVTIQTVTDCILIQLSRQDFWKWIQNDHTCTIILLKKLAKRLYPVSKDRGMIRYYPSIYLLKKFLVKEFVEFNGDHLYIRKTRQQIADEIGVSLRSVERGIKTLKNKKLLNIVKGKVYIDQLMYENLLNEVDD